MTSYFVVAAVIAQAILLLGLWLAVSSAKPLVRVAGALLCLGSLGLVVGTGVGLADCPRFQCEGNTTLPEPIGAIATLLVVGSAATLVAAILVLLVAAITWLWRSRPVNTAGTPH